MKLKSSQHHLFCHHGAGVVILEADCQRATKRDKLDADAWGSAGIHNIVSDPGNFAQFLFGPVALLWKERAALKEGL